MAQTKRVLIVEDDIPLLEALAQKFSGAGFEVLKAKDGQEGLSVALKNCPDIILLDIIMPKMHGWEMLERLREDKWGKTALVMILTNVGDPSKKQKALESGVSDYLVKTELRLEDVIQKVRDRLGMD
ncbi:MAG: response regulator [Patescibacteria group bacterium]